MIKLIKGFSLAELLIAMGIIAIIAVMGLNISKNGIAKAYNYYIYNAYKTLSLAMAETGIKFDSVPNVNNALRNVASLLDTNLIFVQNYNHYEWTIKAKNNVTYKISTDVGNDFYQINIIVPSAKWVNDSGDILTTREFYFVVDPEHINYGIIPVDISPNTPIANSFRKKSFNLAERRDLLPFTIDDGESARIVQKFYKNDTGGISVQSPYFLDEDNKSLKIYSFKEAFCKLYGTYDSGKNTVYTQRPPIYSCEGIATRTSSGVIRVLDPRKIYQ